MKEAVAEAVSEEIGRLLESNGRHVLTGDKLAVSEEEATVMIGAKSPGAPWSAVSNSRVESSAATIAVAISM